MGNQQYRVTLNGTWPADGTQFMITPVQSTDYTLPVGTMTGAFTDASTGQAANFYSASVDLSFGSSGDLSAFVSSTKSKSVMGRALASALNLSESYISIKQITQISGNKALVEFYM